MAGTSRNERVSCFMFVVALCAYDGCCGHGSERAAAHESLAPGGESGGGDVSVFFFFFLVFFGVIIESDTTDCCTGPVSDLPCFALGFVFVIFVLFF